MKSPTITCNYSGLHQETIPFYHSICIPPRFLPIIGQYEISDVAKMTVNLWHEYGKIVRMQGLIGRPDLLFVNDADEIEKVRITNSLTHF